MKKTTGIILAFLLLGILLNENTLNENTLNENTLNENTLNENTLNENLLSYTMPLAHPPPRKNINREPLDTNITPTSLIKLEESYKKKDNQFKIIDINEITPIELITIERNYQTDQKTDLDIDIDYQITPRHLITIEENYKESTESNYYLYENRIDYLPLELVQEEDNYNSFSSRP